MDDLETCEEWHTGSQKCCAHIRKVLKAMRDNRVEPHGDTQVCGLKCKQCSSTDDQMFHGF